MHWTAYLGLFWMPCVCIQGNSIGGIPHDNTPSLSQIPYREQHHKSDSHHTFWFLDAKCSSGSVELEKLNGGCPWWMSISLTLQQYLKGVDCTLSVTGLTTAGSLRTTSSLLSMALGIIGVILAKAGSSAFLVTAYTLELLVVKGKKNKFLNLALWQHCQ